MRLESCEEFNIEKFIKNINGKWKEEKKQLQEQLDSITELPSIENQSGVRGTEKSDPTSKQAILRMKIEHDIEDIEWCEKVYEMAKQRLPDTERELFNGFFESKGKKAMWKFVEEQCEKNHTTQSSIYRKRQEILDKYKDIVETLYL